MLKNAPLVCVLTIHHGPNSSLNRLKDALAKQSYPMHRFRWVVIDDASPDSPPEWFDSSDERFEISAVRLPENVGRAKARNHALAQANGEIVAFIDSDMEPVSVWLEMLVRGVQKTKGVIAGRYDPDPSIELDSFQRYVHTRGAHKHVPGTRIPGRYFTSGNCAFPRFFLEHVDGFDEGFSGWGGEDLEFAIRLEKKGAVFHFEPRARSFHDHRVTWEEQANRYLDFGVFAMPRLLEKHPGLEGKLSLSKLRFSLNMGLVEGLLQPLLLRLVCNDAVYQRVHALVCQYKDIPWPARVFDYMVFHLYSRAYARNL
jgi:glycosyltransferase involved in cell wall biosynthesis